MSENKTLDGPDKYCMKQCRRRLHIPPFFLILHSIPTNPLHAVMQAYRHTNKIRGLKNFVGDPKNIVIL